MNTKEVRVTFRGVDKTRQAFGRIRKNFKDMERLSASVTRGFGGIGIALTAAFGGRAIKQIIDTGDKIGKLSTRLGMTTESLSELKYVAELSGVEFNSLTTGLQRMTRRVSEAAMGTGSAKNALVELGLSAQELKALRPEEQFELIADRLAGVTNESDRVRLAMKLFDTEGVALLQTMENGSEGIRKLREEARKLGLSLSGEDTAAMAEFNDAIIKLQASMQGLIVQVLLPILPAITSFLDSIREGHPLVTFLTTAVTTLLGLKLAAWVISATMAVRAFTVALIANPIGLVATAISLTVAALISLAQWFWSTSDAAENYNETLNKTAKEHEKLVKASLPDSLAKENNLLKEKNKLIEDTKAPMQTHIQNSQQLNNVIDQGTLAQKNYTEQLLGTKNACIETQSSQQQLFNSIEANSTKAANTLQQCFTNALKSTKIQVNDLNATLNNLFDSLMQNITNSFGGGMNFGDGIGGLLNGLFGGSGGGFGNSGGGIGDMLGSFFAKGGTAKPGKAHVVGDGGEPELFVPNSIGSIVPYSNLATAGGNINVNMHVQTPDLASFNQSRSQIIADMARQINMSRRNL